MIVITENRGKLNMRERPSSTSAVLAQIPYLAEVSAESYNTEWSKVSYDGKTGYVMNKFLTENTITKDELKSIYNKLNECLKLISEVIK